MKTSATHHQPARLWLIDDDDLSREIIGLIASEAGFQSSSFASGEEALLYLAQFASEPPPDVFLADMQMPGLSGNDLAQRLREACGAETVLLAMSGTPVAPQTASSFDGFLLKPFSAENLIAFSQRNGKQEEEPSPRREAVLNLTVYEHFARSLPSGQLAGLYRMCLDDALKRLETMRRASAQRDDAAYRRAAHAIKGGCGMVGALELAALAAAMEENGLPPLNDDAPRQSFLAATARLERMLEDKVNAPRSAATVVPL